MSVRKNPQYGIDAPLIILLFILGGIALICVATMMISLSKLLAGWIFLTGLVFFVEGLWMLFSSIKGKSCVADRAIRHLVKKGDERILDIGCGSGQLLVNIARRLDTGSAIGIDIWSSKDQSNNKIDKTRQNIFCERLELKAEVLSADMRELPFESSYFDGVLASLSIHNLSNSIDRIKALREIDRVLKPRGYAVFIDFQYINEYANFFKEHYQVTISSKQWLMFPPTRILVAIKNQSTAQSIKDIQT